MENFSFLFSSHMCVFQTVRQEKRKPLNRFFGEIGGIYSHLVAKSTPDAHISPGKKTTEPVYFQAGTLASEKHCVQLLLGLSLHTHTTHTEHTLHRSSRQTQSVFWGEFFGRCWKPCTRLRPRHFNKDLKPHAQAHAGEPRAVLGASSPYASSQSRGDVSRCTNVNVAAGLGGLSNTLTHNLFRAKP